MALDLGLEGKVAVVTGAGGNLGRAVAQALLDQGVRVVAHDRDAGALAWAEGLPGVVPAVGDVTLAQDNEAMARAAVDTFGALDIAVLNAGVAGGPGIEEPGAVARFQEVMSINLGGVFLGMRACLPVMRERGGGAIVAMSSVEGLGGSPGLYAYNTSKAAILNLVRAVAMDYAASGVRVNAVCPGMVAPANPEASSPAAREVHRVVTANIPMGRPARADEVGDAVVFLSSARASYITGEALCVDGGVRARTGSFPPRAAGAPAGFDGASMRASAGTHAHED